MKKIVLLLFYTFCLSISSFSQNYDWQHIFQASISGTPSYFYNRTKI